MNELQLRTTEMFGEVQTNIYENDNHEMFMTARQLGECLGYSDPMRNINKLLERNEYLKNPKYSGVVNLSTPQGNRMVNTELRVFNERGIYEVSFKANTDKALAFRDWVGDLLIALRKGDLQLAKSNVIFSKELFDSVLKKYVGSFDSRLVAIENKKPDKPNFWLWKKNVAGVVINNLVEKLQIDARTAYDLVYDGMCITYGFDKQFAMNQFCTKYGFKEAYIIDAIADIPEYQKEFIATANKLVVNADIPVESSVSSKPTPKLDKVQEVIAPLIAKYNDRSFNGAKTYGKVYAIMYTDKGWKNIMTRNKCKTKKQVLLKDDNKFKQFKTCVDQLLLESEVTANES